MNVLKVIGVLAVLAAVIAASGTVGAGKAQASNPVYAYQLAREGERVSNQIVRLAAAGQRSNSVRMMCGYYVPQINVKVRRLHQIVRLLYVNAPGSMRSQIVGLAAAVRRLTSMVGTMRSLCVVYG